MHEFSVAANILKTVGSEAARMDAGRIVKVGVTVGALSGIDAEALRFSFSAMAKESEFGPLELEIERVPHSRRCEECSHTFEVDVLQFDATCPQCGNAFTESAGGEELEITYIEVEDS